MNNLMSKIDDIKTKITDQEYKQLCDEMMELNKKKEDFYEIKYLETRIHTSVRDDELTYTPVSFIEKRTVKMNMTDREIEYANKQIDECGIYCGQSGMKDQSAIREIIDNRRVSTLFKLNDNGDYEETHLMPSTGIDIISIKRL